MDLKDKVINLEYAQHLQELGVNHSKATFSWMKHDYQKKYHVGFTRYNSKGGIQIDNSLEQYPAFTSDELIDLLPCVIDTKKGEPFNFFWLEIHKRSAKNIQYCVKYIGDTAGVDRFGKISSVSFGNRNVHDENLPNALAKMLIYLINENLYVKIEPTDIDELLSQN